MVIGLHKFEKTVSQSFMTTRILVIEDDRDINALITINIKALNFEVDSVHGGEEGFNLARDGHYDLLVLDLMLPGIQGLEICSKLREKGHMIPILMLTAKKSEIDRVVGLEVGADDYLTKPFNVRELQARVKALLRRAAICQAPKEPEQTISCNGLLIDTNKRSVTLHSREVELTSKEFDLLHYLAQHPGRVFRREQLLNSVWGYQHSGYEHTVNSHINRLRAKLETNPAKPEFVLTVWGVGYKFSDQAST